MSKIQVEGDDEIEVGQNVKINTFSLKLTLFLRPNNKTMTNLAKINKSRNLENQRFKLDS